MSSVLPIFLSGLLFLIRSCDVSFFKRRSDILLLKRDGEMQFTRYLGANSAANDLQRPTKADLDIEIEEWKGRPILPARELIKTIEHPSLK